MEYKDYYKILGIEKNASKEQIKKAYRKLARELHPDLNPNNKKASARFAEVNEANEVLSDDGKRRKYDALGADWRQYEAAGRQGDFDWSQYATGDGGGVFFEGSLDDLFAGGGFSDFFQNIFGIGGNRRREGGSRQDGVNRRTSGRSRGRSAGRGADLQAELPIELEEAYSGCVKTFEANGRSLRLTLEPGLRDNQTIKLKGKGAPGANGGENGDLFLTLKIPPHAVNRREGDDLHRDVGISFYKAVLGGEQTVKLISGSIKIKIKPETKNGTVVRVPGKGFPVYGKKGVFGDLYLTLVAETPQGLSGREKELVKELARLRGEE